MKVVIGRFSPIHIQTPLIDVDCKYEKSHNFSDIGYANVMFGVSVCIVPGHVLQTGALYTNTTIPYLASNLRELIPSYQSQSDLGSSITSRLLTHASLKKGPPLTSSYCLDYSNGFSEYFLIMQTLWARVAQVRCTSCLSDSTALGRRVATSSFKYRLRSIDVFTVFYSSVLFTAAVADATRKQADTSRKQARLRELHDAVVVARADLKAVEDQQQSRLDALLYTGDEKENRLVQNGWTREDQQQSQVDALSNTAGGKNDRLVQWKFPWDDQQQIRLDTLSNTAYEKKDYLAQERWTIGDQQQRRLNDLSKIADGKNDRLIEDRSTREDPQQSRLGALSNIASEKNGQLAQWKYPWKDQKQIRFDTHLNSADEKKYRLYLCKWTWKDQAERENALLSCSDDVYEMKRLAKEGCWLWGDIFEWESREMKDRESLGFKDFKGVHLNILKNLSTSEIEDAMYNDPLLIRILRKSKTSGEAGDPKSFPVSWKKVRTLEWSILRLACTLLRHARDPMMPLDGQSEMLQDKSLRPDKMGSGPLGSSMAAGQNEKFATRLCKCLTKKMHMRSTKNIYRRLMEKLEKLLTRKMYRLLMNKIYRRLTKKTYRRFTRKIEEASHRIRQLSKIPQESGFDFESFHTPQTPRFNCWHDHDKAALFNSSLANTFLTFQHSGEKLSSVIGKIGYQLLTSDSPPNVHTYTLLVKNLATVGHPQMVKSVLISMNECHIRPDADFLATLLDFYSSTLNIKQFKMLTAQMKGYYHGLAVANPNTKITPITRGNYRVVTSPKKDKSKNASGQVIRIYEKPLMSPEAYGALINGSLKLFGYKKSMVNYINMVSEGYKPTLQALSSILEYCWKETDWEGGYLAWQKIQATPLGADFSAYFWMLELCKKCRKKGMFWLLLTEGAECGIFPFIVTSFPEKIGMDLDVIVQSAIEHVELRERIQSKSSIAEPAGRLWNYFSVICSEMVKTAKEFTDVELSIGRAPSLGREVAKKMGSARHKVSCFAIWNENRELEQRKSEQRTNVKIIRRCWTAPKHSHFHWKSSAVRN